QVVLRRADPLSAHLGDVAAADLVVEGPAADAAAGFEDENRAAGAKQLPRGRQPCEAGSDDDHVGAAPAAAIPRLAALCLLCLLWERALGQMGADRHPRPGADEPAPAQPLLFAVSSLSHLAQSADPGARPLSGRN